MLLDTELDGEPEGTGAFEDRDISPAPPVERLAREGPIFDELILCDWWFGEERACRDFACCWWRPLFFSIIKLEGGDAAGTDAADGGADTLIDDAFIWGD